MQTLQSADRVAFLEAVSDLTEIDGLRRALEMVERLDPQSGMVVVNLYGTDVGNGGVLGDAFWDFLDVVVHLQTDGPDVIFTEPNASAIRQLVARRYLPSSALITEDSASAVCASGSLMM